MTTILDTLVKELHEEKAEQTKQLVDDHTLETADVRGIQGRIWMIGLILRRIDDLRRDPDELKEDDDS